MSPVPPTIRPRNTTPSQNQVFSPKLKRCEGTCSPLSRPPALRIHSGIDGLPDVVPQEQHHHEHHRDEEQRPDEVGHALRRPGDSRSGVADQQQQQVLAEHSMQMPVRARITKVLASDQWASRSMN